MPPCPPSVNVDPHGKVKTDTNERFLLRPMRTWFDSNIELWGKGDEFANKREIVR